MASTIKHNCANRSQSNRRHKRPNRQCLQKPNGLLGPRVKQVGADKFAFVCIDPAKRRSEWMMADYLGNLLIEPRTLEHGPAHFQAAEAHGTKT